MICLPVKAQLDSQAGCGNGLYDIPCLGLGMVIPATPITTPDYSLVPGAKIAQKTFGSSVLTDATSKEATSTEATTTPVYSTYKFLLAGAFITGYGTSSEQVIYNYTQYKLNTCDTGVYIDVQKNGWNDWVKQWLLDNCAREWATSTATAITK